MIPEKLTYLFVNFFTLVFPLVFSFTKWFNFKDYWKFYFPGNILVALVYLAWDAFYTHVGVWGFGYEYTLGVNFFGLPIDEYFFFICTPYACVFTYFCFKKFVFKNILMEGNWLWIATGFIYAVIAMFYSDKLYTSMAFLTCAITCFVSYYTKLISGLKFYLFYAVILVPFTLCNGILTGSFLNRVVVHYNDHENLGIRILTIPVEDIFYGMAMLLFNILLFEYFLRRNKVSV